MFGDYVVCIGPTYILFDVDHKRFTTCTLFVQFSMHIHIVLQSSSSSFRLIFIGPCDISINYCCILWIKLFISTDSKRSMITFQCSEDNIEKLIGFLCVAPIENRRCSLQVYTLFFVSLSNHFLLLYYYFFSSSFVFAFISMHTRCPCHCCYRCFLNLHYTYTFPKRSTVSVN